jgi:hypothetical protein
MSGIRLIGTVNAIRVDHAGTPGGQITVPDFVGIFRQLDAFDFPLAIFVKETELHLGRMCGEQCEIDAEAIPGRAQREGPPLGQ